jgi:bacteriorhodopsin
MSAATVYNSLIVSVIIQILTGIVEFLALFVKVPLNFNIIRQLLTLEIIVQFIEGSFYLYWLYNFNNLSNITPKRYLDWVITTPTMLVTLVLYLIFLHNRENNIEKSLDFFELISENFTNLSYILVLNWLMLLFGYLGEVNIIPVLLGVTLGFIPFFIYYYIIYTNYAVLSEDGYKIFLYFLFFWSLYGVAAVLPYNIKNTFYNILDLFAKNFFGIFLTYIILTNNY